MTQNPQILIADNESKFTSELRAALETLSCVVEVASTGPEAISKVRQLKPVLLLLDLLLPDVDGFAVAAVTRAESPFTRIIVLSPIEDAETSARAVRINADEHVKKPVDTIALVGRAVHQLWISKTGTESNGSIIRLGDVAVNRLQRRVERRGSEIHLAKREYELLIELIDAGGAVCSKEALLAKIWGFKSYVATRTLDYHISRLRAKLEPQPHAPQLILTEWKVGYRICCDH